MKEALAVTVVVLLWPGLALAQNGQCISNTSISLDMEDATSNFPSPPNHDPTELSTRGWCVGEVLGLPYIEIRFEDPVLFYNGTIEAVNGSLVTAVQLQVVVGEDEEFQYITDSSTGLPMIFYTENSTNSSLLVIKFSDEGLYALSLKIIPYTWTQNPLCMKMELAGCQTDTDYEAPRVDSIESLCLHIAMPSAIVLLLIIVAMNLICCYGISRRQRRVKMIMKPRNESDIESTIKHVKNDLYHPTKNRSRARSSDSTTYIIPGSPQPYEVPRSPVDTGSPMSTMSSAGYTKVRTGRGMNAYDTVAADLEPDVDTAETDVEIIQSDDQEMYLNVVTPQIAEESFSAPFTGKKRKSDYIDREALERDLGLTVTESFGPEQYRV